MLFESGGEVAEFGRCFALDVPAWCFRVERYEACSYGNFINSEVIGSSSRFAVGCPFMTISLVMSRTITPSA